jgi:hypothetical protein
MAVPRLCSGWGPERGASLSPARDVAFLSSEGALHGLLTFLRAEDVPLAYVPLATADKHLWLLAVPQRGP